jgi:hypothetical protein
MKRAVQDTVGRLVAITSISGHLLFKGFSHIQITHHKLIPVPVIDPTFVIKVGTLKLDPILMFL